MIVTLTTDFGATEFVAAMKGVILAMNPNAQVVDIRHDVEPGNVAEGAFAMYAAAPYFPFAVHLGVVDPGVGTHRRALAVVCENGLLVGPDNGLLIPAAKRLGMKEVRELANPGFWRQPVHPTFHGRDVFAPVAAHLTLGVKPADLGPSMPDPLDVGFGEPEASANALRARVIYVDRFGNVVTNVTQEAAEARWPYGATARLEARGRDFRVPFLRTYGIADRGALLLTIGSHGFLEVAANEGSAAQRTKLRYGDTIELSS